MAHDAQTTGSTVSGGRRTTPPFRADHVGSLLRPPRLLDAREDLAKGTHHRRGAAHDRG